MLAILTTHPIQYQVPLWQALARDGRVPFEVWYLTDHGTRRSRDREFGQTFAWDIDTLSGYTHRFLKVDQRATPTSFWRCRLRERLRERLRASQVTALWVQGWQVAAYWQAVREAHSVGAEVWLRGESNDLAPQPLWWKRSLKKVRNAWLFRRVDRFFYIGKANRRLYEKSGVTNAKLYSAPYAVDNDRFATQAAAIRGRRTELRKQWGIPEDAFCILFCGKFIPKKRPFDLVAAARTLMERGGVLKLHLLFVGSGVLGLELRRACQVVCDTEGLTASKIGNIKYGLPLPPASFTGFLNQKEISQAYVAADCLVLPSDYRETWGLVVNEALASGLPCLVSQACGCAEELAGCGAFAPGDIDTLSAELGGLAETGCKVVAPPTISESVSSIVRAYCESTTPDPGDRFNTLLNESGNSAS